MSQLVKANKTAPAVIDEQRQYLTFSLERESYAIDIMAIREIIEFGQLTEVPRMPSCVRGVINLRGAVVPVIDLCARFGNTLATVSRRTCIVIIEVIADGEQQVIGVMVDAVNAVLEIPRDQIEAAPAFGSRIRTDFIAGIGKVNGRFVIILDVDHVLSMDEMAALAASDQPAAA